MEAHNCPNKSNHVSGFPAYDRVPCPWCWKAYILKEALVSKEIK